MNILHYSLGFPPYRTGGLTKFCVDLMNQQVAEGHEVSMLWPGRISMLHRNTHIRYCGKNGAINSYEVINPTPVSYDEGILETEVFMRYGDEKTYESFLRNLKPEVVHVHTLMGIHKAFLAAAKRLDIRVVFSAHDFFPICPKVTMFRDGKICDSIEQCENCGACNVTALSLQKMSLLQSGVYRALKDSYFVKKLRKQHRDSYLSDSAGKQGQAVRISRSASNYQTLRDHYKKILELTDVIHYNSTVTQSVYEKYLHPSGPEAIRIPITHSDILDHRKEKDFNHLLRISYLGPAGVGKGFFLLQKALDKLWNDDEKGRQDFCLNIYFHPAERSPYMEVHDRYTYDQLEEILDNTDVLVIPSLWYETYGYTVLEALSCGVPVIISDTVGAKDILPEGAGIILVNNTVDNLAECIKQLSTKQLQKMNDIIVEKLEIPTIMSMSKSIAEMCYQMNATGDTR